jgi:hypothetical protein
MVLVRVTNITENQSLSFSGNILIHPGEDNVFDVLTAEIQKMEDRGLISIEIIGDPATETIAPVGGFDSLREELNEVYQRLNDDRQLNARGFGVKGGE